MQTRTTPRQAPLSPIKPSALTIPPEEYVHTPGSSVTSSPAESCVNDAEKQLKPWERSASVTSSVNSSETIEDTADDAEEEPEQATDLSKNTDTRAQAMKLQTHLRGAQRRLDGLQRLMHEAALHSSLLSHSQTDPHNCLIIAAEVNVAASESPDLQRRTAPSPKQRVDNFVRSESTSPGEYTSTEDAPSDEANDSRDDQHDSSSSSSEDDGPPAITALLNRIKTLQEQLKEATEENEQLQSTVHRLEEQNARLQAQTAFTPAEGASKVTESGCDQESNYAHSNEAREGLDESFLRLKTAIFGEPSAFQKVMDDDLAILKDHERCQHKLHELWDTVRVLRTFVETYAAEKNAMKIQRDDAIADANRADAENVKLASSSNPQQKIKYLEQVKKDNQALRKKNRALNMRIAKQAAKFIQEKNGCSLLDDGETSIDRITTLDDTLVSEEISAVRSGEEIFRSMRNRSGSLYEDLTRRSGVLEERLESLRLARQELPEVEVESSGEKASVSATELRQNSVS